MEIKSARFVVSAQEPASYPDDGLPQIAVAGRSNVGKSSLLNMLMGRKQLVKTSATPGKTRLINFFRVEERAPAPRAFHLVDIPGFGYTSTGGESRRQMEAAIEAYFRHSRSLKGLLYLVDSRIEKSAVDDEALEWLRGFDFPLLLVATKVDKLKRQDLKRSLGAIAQRHSLPEPPIATSAEEGVGREEVLEQIGILLAGT
jgi:GTP-binding protein